MKLYIICGALATAEKYGKRVAIALFILIAGIVLIRAVGFWVQRAFLRSHVNGMPAGFIAAMVKSLLWLVVVYAAVSALGIPSAPLVAVLGSAGLALSLALKDSLSNLASGIVLLGTKPFASGDYVDINGTEGTVKHIRLMTSELVTPDNKTVVLPNSTVLGACITNFTARSTRRVDIPVSVAYGTDLAALRTQTLRILADSPYALADPPPVLVFSQTSPSSLDFSARVWVRQEDYWDAYRAVGETLAARLLQAGFDIPYTQLRVHTASPVCTEKEAQ